ncbi:hypothetical protein BWR19_17085 [Halomonas sp. 1513]|nr:hypothetical protein [Halomonas sp. 1513]APX94508.1 hypothetical protein BWR19_17085 [Halomonas sp. 1513]
MAKQNPLPDDYSADWIQRLDGRTRLAQAVRQRYTDLTTDLGGHEAMSYQRRSLAKRALWQEAVIEQMEAALARGEDVDLGRMTQSVNALQGLYKTLGLDRVARDVPTLSAYIAAKGAAQ